MRPTTKDLAKAAGVSLATVDRVLNERPGVRPKTVEAVTEAIARIGFVRNQSAANLARQKVYRLAFLLPENGDQFRDALTASIAEARQTLASDAIQIATQAALPNDPHRTADLIAGLSAEDLDGVAIMAPASPQVRDATLRLAQAGVAVVSFVSGQQNDVAFDFVGIDNRAAGATVGRLLGRFAGGQTGKILVVAETMTALDSVERRLGFDQIMTREFPNLTVLPSLETHGREDRAQKIIGHAYRHHNNIVGVYVIATEGRQALSAILKTTDPKRQVIVAHEHTGFTERLLVTGCLDAIIAQSTGHLVRSAVRTLKARIDGQEPIASQERIRIEILLRENLGLPHQS